MLCTNTGAFAPGRGEGPGTARVLGSRNWRAVQDMCRYRHHYPDLVERDSNGDMPNLSFYKNEIRFLPNGCFIEEILQEWKDDYDLLEDNHSYIQWLFPLREPGVNWHAKPLTLREVEAFKSCPEVMERFVQAYELMLGFYGVELEDRATGAVRRAHNYHKCFQNLNWRTHNNLRITRILKSLGELGLEHYQAPLARFFLEETLVRRQLPAVRQSALDYFVFAVRCRRQRRALLRFAWEHFRPPGKFVWAPLHKLRRLRARSPARLPGEDSLGDPFDEARARRRTCGTDEGEGEGPDSAPQEAGSPERDLAGAASEVETCGESAPTPSSPKESKKRKLEVNRREQASEEPGPQSAPDVEEIALNLEVCALSRGGLGAGARDPGSQDPEETERPCPQPAGAKVTDEVRKRRKVDENGAANSEALVPDPTWRSPASEGPETTEAESGAGQEAGRPAGEEHCAPQSLPEGPTQAISGPPVAEGFKSELGHVMGEGVGEGIGGMSHLHLAAVPVRLAVWSLCGTEL
ncbi:opioid growth factor receptor [Orycteropus afer afer]|uniref:Opioid growth factor receptor n=1 Tax=Orycteropus afer afer TaxID=1230840 RepID=A0A8B7AY75_ORYAF|nr:opioid growth factor receptor [Orycteropus afer afer]